MKDFMQCNGHQVVISAEYKATEKTGWIASMFCGGPYHSMAELSQDIGRLIDEKPEGWDLVIDFQDWVHEVDSEKGLPPTPPPMRRYGDIKQ